MRNCDYLNGRRSVLLTGLIVTNTLTGSEESNEPRKSMQLMAMYMGLFAAIRQADYQQHPILFAVILHRTVRCRTATMISIGRQTPSTTRDDRGKSRRLTVPSLRQIEETHFLVEYRKAFCLRCGGETC